VFRESSDLAEDLVFYENYLGKRDATFTLNFSTGSSMVLAQYYNFARLGHSGYRYVMETMKYNARTLAREIAEIGEFEIIGAAEDEQLPLVAFKLQDGHDYDEFDVAARLHAPAERRTRQDHARARQADAQLFDDRHPRSGHRRSVRHARKEGQPASVGSQTREDEHGFLSGAVQA
jgi:glutamate/tyrosine decarboxylase-like PLP-dependent enzyme